MKRRIWIIVTAVTLATAAIGGVAAFAGGGAEEQDTSPSLGIPAPGSKGIDETVVSDGSDLDMGTPGDEGEVIVGDGPISSPVPAPGFEGTVDEMIVIPSEPDSLVHDVDTR